MGSRHYPCRAVCAHTCHLLGASTSPNKRTRNTLLMRVLENTAPARIESAFPVKWLLEEQRWQRLNIGLRGAGHIVWPREEISSAMPEPVSFRLKKGPTSKSILVAKSLRWKCRCGPLGAFGLGSGIVGLRVCARGLPLTRPLSQCSQMPRTLLGTCGSKKARKALLGSFVFKAGPYSQHSKATDA